MRINWIEVSKFLAGAFFVGAIVNAYLYFAQMDVPFLGTTIPHTWLGARAIGQAVLFGLCFYLG